MSAADRIRGYLRPDVRERLSQLIADLQVESVIEVGSFVGQSAVWFAERVPDVICVDVFDLEKGDKATMGHKTWVYQEAGYDTHYETFLHNTLAYPNIRSIKLPSLAAARLPIAADLVFIDASHAYEDVAADIDAWRPKARKVLCGDDNLGSQPGVVRAVTESGIPNREERLWWQLV